MISKHKKRLFITTGNLSLLNALTVIDMDKEKYDDYLIIFSFNMPEKFISANKQIAKIGKFKKIEWLHDWVETTFNFDDFDAIYSVAGLKIDHPNLVWLDEGTGYLPKSFYYPDLPRKTFYWYYLGKCFPENESINTEPDKDIFLNICRKIEESDTEKPEISKKEKTVLIAAQYFLSYFYSDKGKLDFYRKLTEYCINKGFHVYLKPHPREDIDLYKKLKQEFKEKFDLFDSYFPLEVYNLEFTLIISTVCSTLFTSPYFYNIPCANAITPVFKDLYKYLKIDGLFLYLLCKEYTPNYKNLLEKVTPEMSPEKAKQVMLKAFEKHIKHKSKTNKNKKLKSALQSEIVEVNYVKKINHIIGRFLACFIVSKQYRGKIREFEFFKSIKIKKGK